MKKLSQAIVLAGAMTAGLASVQAVQAEVTGSAAVANNYIFRGTLMGDGVPAVSGSLDYTSGGLYVGVWGTSGDTVVTGSDEYNVYVGFGGEAGDLSYDVNLLSYIYPTGNPTDLGQYVELTASLGLAGFGLSLTVPVVDETDVMLGKEYFYTTLSYGYESFGIAVGNLSSGSKEITDYTHIDVTYALTDNVGFMLSKVVDGFDQRMLFQVSYSLPISL